MNGIQMKLVVVMVGLSAIVTCGATTLSWTGAASTDALTAENWNPAHVPTAGDELIIGEGTVATVTLSGTGSFLQANGGSMGNTGSGHSMYISDGARFLTSANFAIGNWANFCTVTVDGAGSDFSAASGARLYVGGSGSDNKLLLKNGATGSVPTGSWAFLEVGNGGSRNMLHIDGAGSAFCASDARIGEKGFTNCVLVTDGGAFYATNSLVINNNGSTGWGNRLIVSNAIFRSIKPNGARVDTTVRRGGRITIVGSDSRALLGGVNLYNRDCYLEILDGAVVTNYAQMNMGYTGNEGEGSDHLIVSNAILNAGYNINAGNYVDHCTIEVLDGAKIYNPSYFFDIGSFATSHDNEMIIDGEGSFVNCSRWRVGGKGYCNRGIIRNGAELSSPAAQLANGNEATSVSNAIEVLDGGTLTLTGWNGSVSSPVNASYSTLRVRNGTVKGKGSDNSIDMKNKGIVRLEGTNSLIKVATLKLVSGGVIEFKPPECGGSLDNAYIQLKSWDATHTDGTTILRVVESKACSRNGGGTYTLVTCENNDLDTFEFAVTELPERARLIREARAIKVKIPGPPTMTIIVR